MPGNDIINDLVRDYRAKRPQILGRLAEFTAVRDKGDGAIFEELSYCILTAGSSAKMGMRTVESLRDLLLSGEEEALQRRAMLGRARFWRVRPSYIYHTREYLREHCGLELRRLVESFPCRESRRDFFAGNNRIKGLGYKEASHFLRNIGFRGYAILDKHILNSLREMGVIDNRMRTATRSGYREIEGRFARFAEEIGIDMDHLDLLLWSRKTGEILK